MTIQMQDLVNKKFEKNLVDEKQWLMIKEIFNIVDDLREILNNKLDSELASDIFDYLNKPKTTKDLNIYKMSVDIFMQLVHESVEAIELYE